MTATLDAPQNVPFLRQLATSDTDTRTEALERLRLYLTSHSLFSSIELLKLWKGLYFCMWMCDTSRLQQRLGVDLSDLLSVLKEENVLPFLDAFWKTMAREWGGIDKLRMDKFLYLMRRYLGVMFVRALRNEDTTEGIVKVIKETPLNVTDQRLPNGLRYHILDIYVDELDRASSDAQQQSVTETIKQLLVPVLDMATHSSTKSVQKRAQETLDDERVKAWLGEDVLDGEARKSVSSKAEKNENVDEDDDDWDGIDED